jgi:hypothetical protein
MNLDTQMKSMTLSGKGKGDDVNAAPILGDVRKSVKVGSTQHKLNPYRCS